MNPSYVKTYDRLGLMSNGDLEVGISQNHAQEIGTLLRVAVISLMRKEGYFLLKCS